MSAREALRLRPLMQATGAHSSRVERVPSATAGTEPRVVLAGRPPAEWAPDARRFRFAGLLFAVWNDDRTVLNGSHVQLL
jgi:hypothetical protein